MIAQPLRGFPPFSSTDGGSLRGLVSSVSIGASEGDMMTASVEMLLTEGSVIPPSGLVGEMKLVPIETPDDEHRVPPVDIRAAIVKRWAVGCVSEEEARHARADILWLLGQLDWRTMP